MKILRNEKFLQYVKKIQKRQVITMNEKTVEQSMQLILHSGTGRSMAIEAVRDLLGGGDAEAAKEKIVMPMAQPGNYVRNG